MMERKVARKTVANSKFCRHLARNKSSSCADIAIGDSALLKKTVNRKCAPLWRGPAKILDIGEAGVTVKFQSRASNVARYCIRKKVGTKDVSEVDWNTAPGTRDLRNGSPTQELKLLGAPWETDLKLILLISS